MKKCARSLIVVATIIAVIGIGLVAAAAAPVPKWEASASNWVGVSTPTAPDTAGLVVGFDGRFVAIGTENDVRSAYTSNDGVTWSIVSSSTSAFTGAGVSGLISGRRGLLAWGGQGQGATSTRAFWTSKDARTWTKVDADPAVFGAPGPGTAVTSVSEGPSGYVAVGVEGTNNTVNGLVWRSKDGSQWTRVVTPPGVFGDATTIRAPLSITYGDGEFVAVGLTENAAADPRDTPLEWTSRDGTDWKLVEGAGALAVPTGLPAGTTFGTGQALLRSVKVFWAGRSYLAWFDLKNGNATSYAETSRDGTKWEPLTLDGLVPASSLGSGAGSGLVALARVGTGKAVLGGVAVDNAQGLSVAPLAWTTANGGTSWKSLSGGAFAPTDSAAYYIFGAAGTATKPLFVGARSEDAGDTLPTYSWIAGKAAKGPATGSSATTTTGAVETGAEGARPLKKPTVATVSAAAGSDWSVSLENQLPFVLGACSSVTTPPHSSVSWKGTGATTAFLSDYVEFASDSDAAAALASISKTTPGCSYTVSTEKLQLKAIDKLEKRSGGQVLHYTQSISFGGSAASQAQTYIIVRGSTLATLSFFGVGSDLDKFADKLIGAMLK